MTYPGLLFLCCLAPWCIITNGSQSAIDEYRQVEIINFLRRYTYFVREDILALPEKIYLLCPRRYTYFAREVYPLWKVSSTGFFWRVSFPVKPQAIPYVQCTFSTRKIVENNECRTSNHRAQHEAKREPLKISGNASHHSFPTNKKRNIVWNETW